jgi:hypothetical protein
MSDDLEAMIERVAREEQDDADEKHGQHILAAVEASAKAAEKPHPLVEAIARAYRAKAGGAQE